jgi:hypothetical protein
VQVRAEERLQAGRVDVGLGVRPAGPGEPGAGAHRVAGGLQVGQVAPDGAGPHLSHQVEPVDALDDRRLGQRLGALAEHPHHRVPGQVVARRAVEDDGQGDGGRRRAVHLGQRAVQGDQVAERGPEEGLVARGQRRAHDAARARVVAGQQVEGAPLRRAVVLLDGEGEAAEGQLGDPPGLPVGPPRPARPRRGLGRRRPGGGAGGGRGEGPGRCSAHRWPTLPARRRPTCRP